MNDKKKDFQNIVLVGFMGCGKSTIGINLAQHLGFSFVDSDEEIEKNNSMKITEIFAQYGEAYFRNLEQKTIEMIMNSQNQVIATGGGVIKNPVNIYNLKKSGIIIYLRATVDHISNNLKDDHSRPLLQGPNKRGKILTLLEERHPFYEKASDIILDISGLSIDAIINNILKRLGENKK